ncbi:hypothetical protein DRQ33_04365 [bacterium]|nr:MAG: hypothetical protein DRQ33_04365 [bacterium]
MIIINTFACCAKVYADAKMEQKQKDILGQTFRKAGDKENLFLQIVAHMDDAVVIVDRNGIIHSANPAAEKMFSRPIDDMIGDKFQYTVHSGKPGFRPIPYQKVELQRGGNTSFIEMHVRELKFHGDTFFMASCRDITELVKLREEKEELPLFDEFTGLYNKRGLFTLSQYQMKLAERSKKGMFLIMVDINNFPKINSILGQEESNKALLEMTEILQNTFRSSDIVAHIEGSEFAIIAVGALRSSAQALENRLLKNVVERNNKPGRKYRLSVSTGMAYFDPESPTSIEELIERARADMLV